MTKPAKCCFNAFVRSLLMIVGFDLFWWFFLFRVYLPLIVVSKLMICEVCYLFFVSMIWALYACFNEWKKFNYWKRGTYQMWLWGKNELIVYWLCLRLVVVFCANVTWKWVKVNIVFKTTTFGLLGIFYICLNACCIYNFTLLYDWS